MSGGLYAQLSASESLFSELEAQFDAGELESAKREISRFFNSPAQKVLPADSLARLWYETGEMAFFAGANELAVQGFLNGWNWERKSGSLPVEKYGAYKRWLYLACLFSANYNTLKLALDRGKGELSQFPEGTPRMGMSGFTDFYYGRYFDHLGDLNTAREYFLASLNTYEQMLAEVGSGPAREFVLRMIGNAYQALGIISKDIGDLDEAIEYYSKEEAIYRSIPLPEPNSNYAANFVNMANLYEAKGDYRKAMYLLEKAYLLRLTINGPTSTKVATILINIGTVQELEGDFEQALENYREAFRIYEFNYPDNPRHPDLAETCLYIAGALYETGNSGEAWDKYLHALDIYLGVFGFEHHGTSKCFRGMGDVARAEGRLSDAVDCYQTALLALSGDFSSCEPGQNPAPSEVNSGMEMLTTLRLKGQVLNDLFSQSREQKWLRAALNCYQDASGLVKKLRQSMHAEGSKLLLSSKAVPLFEEGIRTAMEMHRQRPTPKNIEIAFGFAEQSKGMVLLESMKVQELQASKDPELRKLQRELNNTYRDFEREAREAENDPDRDNRLQQLRFRIDGFERELQREYPDYYNLNYEVPTIPPKQIRKEILGENKVLVEYFLGDSSVFIFVLTPQTEVPMEIQVGKDFPERIVRLKTALQNLNGIDEASRRIYTEEAFFLYQKLFEPIRQFIGDREVIVIPDGVLGYIPFEILLTEMPAKGTSFARYPFLIRDGNFCFHYDFSATLLWENSVNRSRRKARDLIGFTPDFGESDLALPTIRESVEELVDRSGGRLFQGKQASKAVFLSNSYEDCILNLGTHAYLNDSVPLYSNIVFSADPEHPGDSALYAYELFNHDLNASLVILNACETGSGKMLKGEGIMSLARGFTYAGCPSILMSQWKVVGTHHSTADISQEFYRGLRQGKSKNQALYDAKLAYLENNPKGIESNPFYWGEMVLVGDPSPIYNPLSKILFGASLMGIFLLMLGLLRLGQRKSPA